MTLLRFLHLTDLHLVEPGETLYGLDPAARLRQAVASMAQRHGPGSAAPAAFAVATGDLTHFGTPSSYRLLRDILGALPFPCHLMLGNHDERPAFRAVFPEAPVDPAGFIQQAVPTPAGRCILLDTKIEGTHAGELGPLRLDWLAEQLSEDAEPVFLFLHHPPLPVGITGMDNIPLRDAAALGRVLAPHRGRIRQIFHGHLHRPLHGTWQGIPFASLRGTSHQVALDLSERPKIPGSHEPPAYAVVQATAHDVVIHVHDFLDETAVFDL